MRLCVSRDYDIRKELRYEENDNTYLRDYHRILHLFDSHQQLYE